MTLLPRMSLNCKTLLYPVDLLGKNRPPTRANRLIAERLSGYDEMQTQIRPGDTKPASKRGYITIPTPLIEVHVGSSGRGAKPQ